MTHRRHYERRKRYRPTLAMRLDLVSQQWATLRVFPRRELWEVRMEVTGYVPDDFDEIKDELTFRNKEPCTASEMVPIALQFLEQLTETGDPELGQPFEHVTGGAIELHKLTLMSRRG